MKYYHRIKCNECGRPMLVQGYKREDLWIWLEDKQKLYAGRVSGYEKQGDLERARICHNFSSAIGELLTKLKKEGQQ